MAAKVLYKPLVLETMKHCKQIMGLMKKTDKFLRGSPPSIWRGDQPSTVAWCIVGRGEVCPGYEHHETIEDPGNNCDCWRIESPQQIGDSKRACKYQATSRGYKASLPWCCKWRFNQDSFQLDPNSGYEWIFSSGGIFVDQQRPMSIFVFVRYIKCWVRIAPERDYCGYGGFHKWRYP